MNRKNQGRAENNYEPLLCEFCPVDLLGKGNGGNFNWVMNPDESSTIRRVAAYWACWDCDKKMRANLYLEKYELDWKGIAELLNPLEHKRWAKVILRGIERGEISETAAVKASKVLMTTAPFSNRNSTERDIVRFRQLRWFDGL